MKNAISEAMSIFGRAVEIAPPCDRAAFLDEACAGRAAVRAEVEDLLNAHGSAGSFMGYPAAPAVETALYEAPVAEGVGSNVGPYRLMEQFGEGGMGLVFVAEQLQPVRRKVALKVIKPGMDTRQVVARFEAERQALALMDHPNIAKVLDAGTTAGGLPYFVMELVRGVPITEYCDAVSLPPRQRLELFQQVCRAVLHAHQKGVIHRDLKPSNILVAPHDGLPVVKVIDFGVAKALGQQLTEKTIYTSLAQMIGTPLYMSPEQAEVNQLDVDTRSDVYSLGVLLYELLTGTTPLDRQRLKTAAFDEIRRIIREEEPPRPSLRLTTLGEELRRVSARRGLDPAQLSRLLRGELDWIVMRCLEKDRTRRYETVAGLAKDVQRFLADEPVEARPVSIWYRIRKAYRRNRAAIATAAGFALLLVVGLTLVTWKWQAERTARADADAARRDAEDRARELQDGAKKMNAANAAMDLGDMYLNFALWAEAEVEYTKAIGLRPDHSSAWMRRSRFYVRLGLGDLAVADSRSAFERQEPDSPQDWSQHGLLLLEAGDIPGYEHVSRRMRERFAASSDQFAIGNLVAVWGQSPSPSPEYPAVVRRLEGTFRDLDIGESGVLPFILGTGYLRIDRIEDAITNLRRALTDTTWRWRAIAYPALAMALYKNGRTEEARQELARARAVLDRWTGEVFDSRNQFVPVQQWRDWLGMQRWCREAHLLIEGVEPPDDPRIRALRERALNALHRN